MNSTMHLLGFEKEARLSEIFSEINQAGISLQWKQFKQIAEMLSPELVNGAFERRSCARKLKYISEDESSFFEKGKIYNSIDFNGATYSMENYERKIGYVYFELIND